MKTKFILHGGYATKQNHENDNFFKEILKDAPQNSKILLVFFAKEKSEYLKMLEKDTLQFRRNKGKHNLSFVIASQKNFPQQIAQSDIIYLHGGKTSRLLTELKNHSDFSNLINGKIVASESAGAYVLSSCFYSKTEGGVFKGLGFVPVKTICHYVGLNKEKLDECQTKAKTLLLADYQYKVFFIKIKSWITI